MKDYYQLLEIAPTAPTDEVKRAFRQQIARYHPDKVQHLGREFQAMAAARAAELTEAYRILSDDARRAEYDLARTTSGGGAAVATSPPPAAPPPAEPVAPNGEWFSQERASRDEYVRTATLGRFRQAFAKTASDKYDESQVRGFDIAFVPKAKLFGRGKGPRLLGRFVARVDGEAIADTWAQIVKAVPADEEICVFLMGSGMAPRRELEDAISRQRRKARGAKVTLIPVDTRDWDAHVPIEAPSVCKNLLGCLRAGG